MKLIDGLTAGDASYDRGARGRTGKAHIIVAWSRWVLQARCGAVLSHEYSSDARPDDTFCARCVKASGY